MTDYQDLVKKLTLINEGASIVSLDVNASCDDVQDMKSVIVGILLSSGAQISATFQAPCFDTLLDSLETFFNVQSQIIEQAIDQVNVMAGTDDGSEMPTDMPDEMEFEFGGEMSPEAEIEGPPAEDELGFELPVDQEDELADDDVVVDVDQLASETGDDVDINDARYSHNYSFRNKGTGLFQSLTGEQRIKKGALRTAKKRLGN